MNRIKNQIKESFFNPTLYFLPLLVFMVIDDVWGVNMAWKVSFPVAMILLFYVYFVYNRIFLWHALLSIGYIIIGLIVSFFPEPQKANPFAFYLDEILFILLMISFLTGKKNLEKLVDKTMPHDMPMSNNVNELFRVAKVLLFLVGIYTLINLLFGYDIIKFNVQIINYLFIIYVCCILFLIVYEYLRIGTIRAGLLRETWLPIVNNEGKVTGSIPQETSVSSQEKYMHPVVRMSIIDKGMIFLQQRKANETFEPMLWDTAVKGHVRMGESIDQCLEKAAKACYNIHPIKSVFLANFEYENEIERQYVFLFLTCDADNLLPQYEQPYLTKWWTKKQIEENLNSGIFTEGFKREFEILVRSGVLEREVCDCECALKNLLRDKVTKKSN